jgi:hypothetical protein
MCTTLENKREAAFGFVEVLEETFMVISQQFSVSIQSVWAMCVTARPCHGTPIHRA